MLLATFNGAQWIDEQLRSIIAQRRVVPTLAVSDDASTDDTVAVVRAAVGADATATLLQAAQSSGGAARNFFRLMCEVDASPYDFVALADQDDVWDPDKLARAVACLGASNASGYSAPVRAVWPNGRSKVLRQNGRPTDADYLFEGAGQGCSFVVRADVFAHLQRSLRRHQSELQVIHYHDWALYALCRAQGYRWCFDDWVCMEYRQHDANDTGARSGLAAVAKRLALIRSGWYARQTVAIARLLIATGNDASGVASRYLLMTENGAGRPLARIALCRFVLTSGRRRWVDRLILIWAAASGHLGSRRATSA